MHQPSSTIRKRGPTSTPSKVINSTQDDKPSTRIHPKTVPVPPTPPKWKVWLLASRPHTLTASIIPVLTSASLIHHYDIVSSSSSSSSSSSYNNQIIPQYSSTYLGYLFGTFACLIQLGTNLYNDYSDFIKGADTDDRVGQARATQKGWLTPKETLWGSCICLGIASLIGCYLTFVSSSIMSAATIAEEGGMMNLKIDYYMIFVTISSVFNAFCYTGGEYPLGYFFGLGDLSIGYSGLGDIFVFLYFGIVATITLPYLMSVQYGNVSLSDSENSSSIWKSELMYISLCTSLPVGFLATNIIVVNNLRDRHTDVLVGKNTMAVRFGEWMSRLEYTVLMIGSYLLLLPLSEILFMMTGKKSNDTVNNDRKKMWVLLPLLSIPLAVKEFKAVGLGGNKDGSALNKHVGGAAKVQMIFCLLLIMGLHCSHSY